MAARKFPTIVLILLTSILGVSATLARGNIRHLFDALSGNGAPSPTLVKADGTIEVAFSPHDGATETVVKAMGEARKSLLVQAYSFTSAPIAKALVDAMNRGVDVKVILDKSQRSERYTSATFIAHHGVPVRIDAEHAIAHNKVMVIDGETVVTGSFNFTKAAELSNAENVLVLRGDKDLARLYTENWQFHWGHSEAYSSE